MRDSRDIVTRRMWGVGKESVKMEEDGGGVWKSGILYRIEKRVGIDRLGKRGVSEVVPSERMVRDFGCYCLE
jgi:hypothetical protein